MSKCPANKILNPASGRCVLRTGKIGKSLSSAPIPKPRKRRPIPPVRTTSKQKRLPNEMWMEISKHLTPTARLNLSQTSTTQYGNTKRHRDIQAKRILANWGPDNLKSQRKSFKLRADNVPDTLEQVIEQISVNARVKNKNLMERVEREIRNSFNLSERQKPTRKDLYEFFKDSYYKNSLKGLSKLSLEKLRLMAARDDGAYVIIEERRKAQV